MKHLWHAVVTLAIALVVLCSLGTCVCAGADFCRSEEFREAFLEGQQGIIIDYSEPSPQLLAYGNEALPCLQELAERGGGVFGIEGCLESTHECRTWALGAIRRIATPEARSYLLTYAKQATERDLRAAAIAALGNLREEPARPYLHTLLADPDPTIRAKSIVALGAIGEALDFEPMLEAALTLPDDEIYIAVHGLRLLGDARAIDTLEPRVQQIEDSTTRFAAESVLDAWRERIVEEQQILTALRSGSGQELYKAIQQAGSPTEAIRAALLQLLDHEDPRARAESVIALGRMHRESDFDLLLRTTLALPEPYVPGAAKGLVFLNDPRAIAPMEEYASKMKNMQRQSQLRQLAEQLRRSTEGISAATTPQ